MDVVRYLPCPECNRHVLEHAEACPFCGEVLDVAERSSPERPGVAASGRLNRIALVTLGAALGASCTLNAVPIYGAPGGGGFGPSPSGGQAGSGAGGGSGRGASGGNGGAGDAGGESGEGGDGAGATGRDVPR